jgi:hypothetical protein
MLSQLARFRAFVLGHMRGHMRESCRSSSAPGHHDLRSLRPICLHALLAFFSRGAGMNSRPHPFSGKLTHEQAEEVRRLRARGLPLANLAGRFGIAKSSVSAIVKLKAHVPDGVLRVALPEFERALLAEIAEDQEVPDEQLASSLLIEMLRSRAW